MRGRVRGARVLVAAVVLGVVAACAGQPSALPTIGSPTPSPTASPVTGDRSAQLARQWELTGAPLPADWPDVPLPRGTEVVTAYAIGSEPRRTWTATFAADTGTALDAARPVVQALRKRDYVPIAEYVGDADTNTGLYSFAAPTFAVYIVLGEDAGRPNLIITVRGSTAPDAGLPTVTEPIKPRPGQTIAPSAPAPSTTSPPTGSPPPSGSPSPSGSTTPSPTPSTTP